MFLMDYELRALSSTFGSFEQASSGKRRLQVESKVSIDDPRGKHAAASC